VAPDLRGFAPSALPSGLDRYTQERVRHDVFAVANALGAERFHLVGHDLGGIVSWDVACRYPSRVLSLAVASTPHLVPFAAALDSNKEARLPPFDLFRRPDGPEELMLAADAADAAVLRAAYAGLDQSSVDAYVDRFQQPGVMIGALNHFRAFDFHDWFSLPPSRVPTVFLWGSDDPYLAPSTAVATRDYVEATYTESELGDVGHWVPELASEQVSTALLGHLGGASG
jgi:pimeloyl-ACP methyl ester carboxylesterase